MMQLLVATLAVGLALPFRDAGMGLASDGYLIRESLRALRSEG